MINYELAMALTDIIGTVLIIIIFSVAWYYITYFALAFTKPPVAPKSDKYTKFAILVPARNESKVIHNIINALKAQSYPKEYFDVWFIIESEDDPTAKIAKENGYHYFVRDELTDQRRTKGFALQECIRYFKNNNILYDAYMIFDADNIMEKDFISKMNDVRQEGVQVGVGYRNFTNASTNWMTATSATLFVYMNTITSRGRTILFRKALLNGTGYYVDSQIIDDAGGWIFTGMTEDTELTGYCYYHDVRMRFYPLAQFYDEQATTIKAIHNQHIRWIWGFFYRKKKVKANRDTINYHATSKARHGAAMLEYRLGLIPMAVAMSIAFLTLVTLLVLAIVSLFDAPQYSWTLFINFTSIFTFTYLLFFGIAMFTLVREKKKLNMSWATILWASATYVLFFAALLWAIVDGLLFPSKRRTWKPIPHDGKIKNKDAKKAANKERKEEKKKSKK